MHQIQDSAGNLLTVKILRASEAARRAEFTQGFSRCCLIIGEDEDQRWNFHEGEFPAGYSTGCHR